jgi:hypothetical protein
VTASIIFLSIGCIIVQFFTPHAFVNQNYYAAVAPGTIPEKSSKNIMTLELLQHRGAKLLVRTQDVRQQQKYQIMKYHKLNLDKRP